LATATASSAISTYTQKQLKKAIRGKLLLSLSTLALSLSLVAGWFLWGFRTWHFYVGVAGLFLALLWGVQYAVLTGRLTLTTSGGLRWKKQDGKKKDKAPSTGEINTDATTDQDHAPEVAEPLEDPGAPTDTSDTA
jgi:hypothetical protein